ncbi:MAG: hypothetical protein MUC38_07675 [Cyclobacteriaceae bacterium]|jgi:hypothetical protein|nr:hypothetical protein [Cyclobacteriaceae bacterium]
MNFKSPLALLRHAQTDSKAIQQADLLKAQKRLLIELDLENAGYLLIENERYTRNDILELLNTALPANHFLFFQWLEKNEGLKRLLTGDTTAIEPVFDHTYRYHPSFAEFQQFLAPRLIPLLSKALHQSFVKKDFVTGKYLLTAAELLPDSATDQIFRKLRGALERLCTEVRDATNHPEKFVQENLRFIDYRFIQFLNAIPDNLKSIRDELAIVLVNLCVKIQTKKYNDFCHGIHQCLVGLNCEEHIKETIRQNLRVFGNQVNQATTPETKSFGYINVIILIALFLFLIPALRSCSKSKPVAQKEFTYRTLDEALDAATGGRAYSLQLSHFQHYLDSLVKMNLDSINFPTQTTITGNLPNPYSPLFKPATNITRFATMHKLPMVSAVFQNNSNYDATILISVQSHLYSTHVPKGESHSVKITRMCKFVFYPGNTWKPQPFTYTSPQDRRETKLLLTGAYHHVDSTSLLYANTQWSFNNTASSDVEFTFESPGPEVFRVSVSNGVLKQLQ